MNEILAVEDMQRMVAFGKRAPMKVVFSTQLRQEDAVLGYRPVWTSNAADPQMPSGNQPVISINLEVRLTFLCVNDKNHKSVGFVWNREDEVGGCTSK